PRSLKVKTSCKARQDYFLPFAFCFLIVFLCFVRLFLSFLLIVLVWLLLVGLPLLVCVCSLEKVGSSVCAKARDNAFSFIAHSPSFQS
ncbi:hypothetical protein, partial [Helicobacter ganmani]|uniref:hypothetical protein n=1 Tax=Helicobacter ganmani TaxID=60246 RepID=UPI003A8BF3D6